MVGTAMGIVFVSVDGVLVDATQRIIEKIDVHAAGIAFHCVASVALIAGIAEISVAQTSTLLVVVTNRIIRKINANAEVLAILSVA